jgi:hypothetical protein
MSDEFDGLDATEKAAIRATLIRCRVLAAKIANELRNKRPEQFVDKLLLADLYASLEHAARLLEQTKTVGSTTHRRPQQRYTKEPTTSHGLTKPAVSAPDPVPLKASERLVFLSKVARRKVRQGRKYLVSSGSYAKKIKNKI